MNAAAPRRTFAIPGALALRLVALLLLAVALAGGLASWLSSRSAADEALARIVRQQDDEVQTLATVLASKIEQSQKVLRTVAASIPQGMLNAPTSLDWLLQQGLPAVQFFDGLVVVSHDGSLRVNLQYGVHEEAAALEPEERDALRRTLASGKPSISELVGSRAGQARVLFTQPLHREDGSIAGVVAGALRLQSQGLLPASMALPQRSGSRLVVFARDGTILSHPDPKRMLGKVSDEPGLAQAAVQWVDRSGTTTPLANQSFLTPGHVVSLADMPLPQWTVARIADTNVVLEPLAVTQQHTWWLVAAAVALVALFTSALALWQLQPLALLRDRSLGMALEPQFEDSMAPPAALNDEVQVLSHVIDMVEQERHGHFQRDHALGGRLQAILDHAPVGLVITRGSRLRMLGRQAAQMLGYTPHELRGRRVRELFRSDDDYAEWKQRTSVAFDSHGAFDGDACFTRKDGSPMWARVQGRSAESPGIVADMVWILEELTAVHEARRQRGPTQNLDPVTGLMDRRAFEERLQGVLLGLDPAAAEDDDASSGVVMCIDLDHFSVVNDMAGHAAGDDVLKHVARLLEAQVRQAGWIARPGGDEFFVVLPTCSVAHGVAVAEQMRTEVQAWQPHYAGRSFTLGLSIGVVPLTGRQRKVPPVLRAADMACYEAKRAGRNQVVLHSDNRIAPKGAPV